MVPVVLSDVLWLAGGTTFKAQRPDDAVAVPALTPAQLFRVRAPPLSGTPSLGCNIFSPSVGVF
jgi:hypothetical protein